MPVEQALGGHAANRLFRLLNERARRRKEALKFYEPLPLQQAFHASRAKQRVIRGGNRSGKTMAAAIEVARAVCGCDPHGKYPERDGRAWIVGKDLSHIGQVMWRKLSRKGAFKMIKDAETGQWRAYRPWDPADIARIKEAKDAPPLIPPRMIEAGGIAWENKRKGIPKLVTLKNGWELSFFSSEGKPPRGADIDLWWFDEEIVDDDWHPEMVARTLDRAGKGIWSATPQSGTDRLYDLHDRAEREEGNPNPAVQEFLALLMENPHVSEEEKKEFINSLAEDDIDVRVHGEFALKHRKVFPEWSDALHTIDPFAIPHSWTRYVFIDPGRQVCAVAFCAIPPRDGEGEYDGDFVYLYDELYLKACSADEFGRKMAEKASGQVFEAFIVDDRGARLTDIGSGKSVRQQYTDALKKHNVSSLRTGFSMNPANDDVQGGVEAARAMLRLREDGTTRLRVFNCCKNFMWEVRRYPYKMAGSEITDVPKHVGRVHQMANFRYLASYPMRFVVRTQTPRATGAIAAFREKQKKKKNPSGQRVHLGPGMGNWKGHQS